MLWPRRISSESFICVLGRPARAPSIAPPGTLDKTSRKGAKNLLWFWGLAPQCESKGRVQKLPLLLNTGTVAEAWVSSFNLAGRQNWLPPLLFVFDRTYQRLRLLWSIRVIQNVLVQNTPIFPAVWGGLSRCSRLGMGERGWSRLLQDWNSCTLLRSCFPK